MHPSLYRAGKTPAPLKLELPDGVPANGWSKLEENTMGEFGWKEILKQFLDDDRAKRVAAAWDGDDYATFEQKDSKQLMVFARMRFDGEATASRFFGAYADDLAKRYGDSKDSIKGEQFLGLRSPDGFVALRCVDKDCITTLGADLGTVSKWTQKLGWPSASTGSQTTARKANRTSVVVYAQ
jgi:hypothetical protein